VGNQPAILGVIMPMSSRFQQNKTPHGYRQLAQKCRENARMTSRDNERSRLLEMAQVWELIADRLERAAEPRLIEAAVRCAGKQQF
jgi:hypothetical protein